MFAQLNQISDGVASDFWHNPILQGRVMILKQVAGMSFMGADFRNLPSFILVI